MPTPEALHLQAVKPIAISVKTERCLHTHNRFSLCQTCSNTCPVAAITVAATVTLNAQVCTGCGACLTTCPAGVFEGDDGVANLLEAAAQARGKQVVEIACPRGVAADVQHGATERAPAAVDAVLRADVCLAVLGPATYLSILGLGIGKIVARTDVCAGCPKGAALANIESNLAITSQVIASLQQPQRVIGWSSIAGAEWVERPVAATSGARVSRRGFLRVVTGRPSEAQAPQLIATDAQHPRLHNTPRERQRLLGALQRLVDAQTLPTAQPLPASIFWRLAASEACSACRVCANVCPTSAIRLAVGFDDTYTLSFLSAACTACNECVDMCDDLALSQDGAPSALVLLTMTPVVLRTGPLYRCERCNVRFASAAEAQLCPLCTLRAEQRLGGKMPPGLQRRLARMVRR